MLRLVKALRHRESYGHGTSMVLLRIRITKGIAADIRLSLLNYENIQLQAGVSVASFTWA